MANRIIVRDSINNAPALLCLRRNGGRIQLNEFELSLEQAWLLVRDLADTVIAASLHQIEAVWQAEVTPQSGHDHPLGHSNLKENQLAKVDSDAKEDAGRNDDQGHQSAQQGASRLKGSLSIRTHWTTD